MESFNHQVDSYLHEGLLHENEPGSYGLGKALIASVEFIETLIYLKAIIISGHKF